MHDSRIERAARRAVVAVVACTVVMAGYLAFLRLADRKAGPEAFLVVVVWFAAAASWLVWFWSAYTLVVDAGRARFGRWVALLGWIVPGFAAFAPLWLVQDVWRAPDDPQRPQPLPRPVRTWGALWCASQLCQLVSRMTHRSGRTDVAGGVALALLLLSTPWAVATVRILTARVVLLRDERERALRHAAGVPA